jgi:hypothetical protein
VDRRAGSVEIMLKASARSFILCAKSLNRLIPPGWREVHLRFERLRAVEPSFRGQVATFQIHELFGQNFW